MALQRDDWLSTVWQTAPRLLELAGKLEPTVHVDDATALDDRFLEEHAVAALLWDVDGTLMSHHGSRIAPAFSAVLSRLRHKVPQAVLSNCGENRFQQLATIFGDIPVLKGYRLADSTRVFRCRRGGDEQWIARNCSARTVVSRPSGPLTPVRKPDAELIDAAIDELRAEPRRSVFMVGDQYFTDIAGANLAGIRSVKVRTVRPDSFPIAVRSLHIVERFVFRVLTLAKIGPNSR
jgi:predicted HAD superfamily phosphohydrolase YqeG